jgi:hypothetical protein
VNEEDDKEQNTITDNYVGRSRWTGTMESKITRVGRYYICELALSQHTTRH